MTKKIDKIAKLKASAIKLLRAGQYAAAKKKYTSCLNHQKFDINAKFSRKSLLENEFIRNQLYVCNNLLGIKEKDHFNKEPLFLEAKNILESLIIDFERYVKLQPKDVSYASSKIYHFQASLGHVYEKLGNFYFDSGKNKKGKNKGAKGFELAAKFYNKGLAIWKPRSKRAAEFKQSIIYSYFLAWGETTDEHKLSAYANEVIPVIKSVNFNKLSKDMVVFHLLFLFDAHRILGQFNEAKIYGQQIVTLQVETDFSTFNLFESEKKIVSAINDFMNQSFTEEELTDDDSEKESLTSNDVIMDEAPVSLNTKCLKPYVLVDNDFLELGATERIEKILDSISIGWDECQEIKAKHMEAFRSTHYTLPDLSIVSSTTPSKNYTVHYMKGIRFHSFGIDSFGKALREFTLALHATTDEASRFRTAVYIESIIEELLQKSFAAQTRWALIFPPKPVEKATEKERKDEVKPDLKGYQEGDIKQDLLMSEFDNAKFSKQPQESKNLLSLSGFFSYEIPAEERKRHAAVVNQWNRNNKSKKLQSNSPEENNNPKELHIGVNAELISKLMPLDALQHYVESVLGFYERSIEHEPSVEMSFRP